jgi:VWFA-related protein
MYRRAAIAVLSLVALPGASAQPPAADSDPGPVLKSASQVVQVDVLVVDTSGRPVHGLQQKDFAVADNGQPRDIRIFPGEIDADTAAPRVFSNRFSLKDSRIVTAIVIDAVRRPESQEGGVFLRRSPDGMLALVRGQAKEAISRLEAGQTMAIYAVCPELRVVQDYTSDPDRLLASLNALAFPPASNATLIPPILPALREVARRMAESSGRRSIVWISQGYGEMNAAAVKTVTDETIVALNDINVPLYAVDTRFSPTCQEPLPDMNGGQSRIVTSLVCSQDAGDVWMEDLAQATGGRAFSGGDVSVFRTEVRDLRGRTTSGSSVYRLPRGGGVVDEALRFAVDDSRYAYELGFYVPEPELDGKLHTLSVTLPGKPKYGLRYRSGYIASANVTGPAGVQERTGLEVGIDATIEIAAAQHELYVSLALDPATVTITPNHATLIDETFIETDDSGRQLAKMQETVPVPAPGKQDETVRYTRSVKLAKGAVLLHITVRDQATKRVGSLAIPISKQ